MIEPCNIAIGNRRKGAPGNAADSAEIISDERMAFAASLARPWIYPLAWVHARLMLLDSRLGWLAYQLWLFRIPESERQ
jgi:hypothetical protein